MKKFKPLLTGLVILLFAAPAFAVTIVGTGVSTIDVQAVQDAVDAGGTVNLSETFDFGDDGRIYAGQNGEDVEIIGNNAKIIGGQWPIYCNDKIKLAIRNIHFENAKGTAIGVTKSKHLEITNCTIKNVRTEPFAGIFKRAVPISVSTAHPAPGESTDEKTSNISGKVIIKDCLIDPNKNFDTLDKRATSIYNGQLQMGIAIQRTEAKFYITGNEIYHCNWAGIWIDANMESINIGGTSEAEKNILHSGPQQAFFPVPGLGSGILIGYFDTPYAQSSVYAVGNEIKCESQNANGIRFTGINLKQGAKYEFNNNYFNMVLGEAALACVGAAENSLWEDNNVEGNTKYGILIGDLAQNNEFKNINLKNLLVTDEYIYCGPGTKNNTFSDISLPAGTLNVDKVYDETDGDGTITPDYDGKNNFDQFLGAN
jgi:hypothetical protein